jgi:hypothetical protein
MILKWGSHAHAQDEVGIRITKRSIFDTFGRRMGMVHNWHILGAIHASSQANLTTALGTLEAAYDLDYNDRKLYLNNGTTETEHILLNSACFGGTHVTGFGYIDGPWKMRTEYANRRTFWAMVQGEIRTGSGQYAWKERVRIKGTGGQKFRYMPRLVGSPIAQTLQTATSFYYIQEGSAVGREAYIAAPGPLYPSIEHLEQREIAYYTPEDMRTDGTNPQNEKYLTTWRYVMEATTDAGFSAFTLPDPS